MGGRGYWEGARAALRRADGGAANVGREGRDRVRVRATGVLPGPCGRPTAEHLLGDSGHRIEPVCFDEQGNEVEPVEVCPTCETGSEWPTFAIGKPAADNTRVDMSPYGQSVFVESFDAIQAVDLAFDAMISEVDNEKTCVFLSDVMFNQGEGGRERKVSIPFGQQDRTVFRKIMSAEDTI